MLNKDKLRKIFHKKRKQNYYEVNKDFFKPLIILLKKIYKNKKVYLSTYYPSNYEVNSLKLFESLKKNNRIVTLLPLIKEKNSMLFFQWSPPETLKVNKYGMLEPIENKKSLVPNISLVPLLAFDKKNYRLGYGKGYYDKYLNKYLSLKKNILTIGVAFSFQKYHKLPISKFDVKLDYILTEKGIIK